MSITSTYRSQLGRLPHFLIPLGSRSATTGLALSEDDAGEGDTFRVAPMLFLPLFLDLLSSSSPALSWSLSGLAFERSLPRFFGGGVRSGVDSTELATGRRPQAFGLGSDLRPVLSPFFFP